MTNEQMLAELRALPDPEMLTAGKIDDPLGSDTWYSARTVVKLLRKQRQSLLTDKPVAGEKDPYA